MATNTKLKKFKIQPIKRPCDICEKELIELSSISIRTWDTSRRYKGSNRPIIGTYKIRCCPKCFKLGMNKLEQFF